MFNKEKLSLGGLIGGLLGAAAALQIGNTKDKPLKKVAQTGLFAGLGFLSGYLIEKEIKENRR
jgi:gas vesicle protein